MSTFYAREIECSVCGSVNTYQLVASTNAFGAPDLDLRPPEMQRSTMFAWVQVCPECGYAAADVSTHTIVQREFLESQAYLTCDGMDLRSPLAEKFYRQHMILSVEGKYKEAFFAVLHAAWACDDADDAGSAKACRILAINILERLREADSAESESRMLIRADLLRRSGRFDALIRQYSGLHFSEELLESIRAFQVRKAGEHDDSRYTVADVTGG